MRLTFLLVFLLGASCDGTTQYRIRDERARECVRTCEPGTDWPCTLACEATPMPPFDCSTGRQVACFALGQDSNGVVYLCDVCCSEGSADWAAWREDYCTPLVCTSDDECPTSDARCSANGACVRPD